MRQYAQVEVAPDRWQRLWKLVPTPVREMEELRGVLERAANGEEVLLVAVEELPDSVRWFADDYMGADPGVIDNVIELVDLVIAWDRIQDRDEKSALMRSIGDAIWTHERLTPSSHPTRNSRCYCGSGSKYKDCHGGNP